MTADVPTVTVRCDAIAQVLDQDAFVLRHVDRSEVADVMTVLSARPVLRAVVDELAARRTPQIPAIRAAIAVVSDLVFFVVSTTSTDPLTCDGTLLPERQRMLREQGILDACASVPNLAFQGAHPAAVSAASRRC